MLARLTNLLVVAALGTLIGGFFTKESNALLFVSIGLSVVTILLVLFGAARRAREAPGFDDERGDEPRFAEPVEEFEDEEVYTPPARARAAAAPATQEIAAVDDDDDFLDEDADEDEEDEAYVPPPRARASAAATRPIKTAAKPPRKPAAKSSSAGGGTTVVVVPGRDRFHKAGCRFVAGKETEELTKAAAVRRGYEACSVCKPD